MCRELAVEWSTRASCPHASAAAVVEQAAHAVYNSLAVIAHMMAYKCIVRKRAGLLTASNTCEQAADTPYKYTLLAVMPPMMAGCAVR